VDAPGAKRYFYRLLSRYLSVFIRKENTLAEIDSGSFAVSAFFENSSRLTQLSQLAALDPDYLLLNGNFHYEPDLIAFLKKLHGCCSRKTRIVFLYYSSLWRPLVRLADLLGLRSRTGEQNWIDREDLANLLALCDFEAVYADRKVIAPFYLPLLSGLINRFLAPLPFFRNLWLVNILIARPLKKQAVSAPSVSIVVPARNEAGNIEGLIKRLPKMGPDDELIFVEGHSADDTWAQIERARDIYGKSLKIICARQDGAGKADAVRKGFSLSSKEILMILDADLSVPPEALPDFYRALCEDKAEFLNGSRLVYAHEGRAMKFCNMAGNKFFALVFSFLAGQRFKDTLCGTKVISRENYAKLASNRSFFGEFDPFGDFDLILGSSRLCLKIREIPVRYCERTYGSTNIKRWRHGFILLRMAVFAAKKLKFI
jgi:hypothetical protein